MACDAGNLQLGSTKSSKEKRIKATVLGEGYPPPNLNLIPKLLIATVGQMAHVPTPPLCSLRNNLDGEHGRMGKG